MLITQTVNCRLIQLSNKMQPICREFRKLSKKPLGPLEIRKMLLTKIPIMIGWSRRENRRQTKEWRRSSPGKLLLTNNQSTRNLCKKPHKLRQKSSKFCRRSRQNLKRPKNWQMRGLCARCRYAVPVSPRI